MPAPAAVPAAAPMTVPRTRLPLSRRLPSTPPATAPTPAPTAVLFTDCVPSACVVQAASSRAPRAEHAFMRIRDSLHRSRTEADRWGEMEERLPFGRPRGTCCRCTVNVRLTARARRFDEREADRRGGGEGADSPTVRRALREKE